MGVRASSPSTESAAREDHAGAEDHGGGDDEGDGRDQGEDEELLVVEEHPPADLVKAANCGRWWRTWEDYTLLGDKLAA